MNRYKYSMALLTSLAVVATSSVVAETTTQTGAATVAQALAGTAQAAHETATKAKEAVTSAATKATEVVKSVATTAAAATQAAPAETTHAAAASGEMELGLPPATGPGQCFAKVLTPAQYETQTEQVLLREGTEKMVVHPAKFGKKQEKILVREAAKRLVVVPATFKNESEKVLVRDAERHWVTDLHKRIPLSPEILAAAKAGGVNVDAMQPGECYREYYKPAQYTYKPVEYTQKEAYDVLSVTPPKYETVEEKVLVKEGYKRLIPVPATYTYETEKVLVEPEHTVWKKKRCAGQGCGGETLCLVKVPARYKIIKKRILKTPASVKVVEVPPVYKTIRVRKLAAPATVQTHTVAAVTASYQKREKVSDPVFTWKKAGEKANGFKYTGHQICLTETPAAYKTITKTMVATPASTKEVAIPEQYKTYTVQTVVAPATSEKVTTEPVYGTVTKRVKVSDAKLEWKRVNCKTHKPIKYFSKCDIRAVQRALQARGLYENEPIDGILGPKTRAAIRAFQKSAGLPVTGEPDKNVLKAFNLK